MLQVSNLTFGYGEKPLYEGVSFVVGKNQKVGLVGPNGSGKSTLLSIIDGSETGYTGSVNVQGKIALVPQEIKYDPILESSSTAREYVDHDRIYQEFEIQKMFKGLELDINLDTNPKSLSGGQKTKLALARALFQKPDLLLLDEPTNFMDEPGKKWVSEFLSNYPKALILISHDLKLMDSAIDKILVINPQTKKIDEFKGNYTKAMRLKEEKETLMKRQILAEQKHIKRLEESVIKLRERNTSEKGVRQRVILQRRIERIKDELPELPGQLRKLKITLPEPKRVGEIPISAKRVYKNYGDLNVLADLNFAIIRNERIALIGPNGSGKSTFIKVLMGMIAPDSGEIIKDQNLKVGYYSQEFETFNFDKTVIDVFREKTLHEENFARSFLGRFLFSNEKIFQSIRSLSGGEKTRLAIAILTATNNNLLILDEPTTYLDVMSQRIILESLKQYRGAMIFASHTPEFVKELAPAKVLLFPEQKMIFWDDQLLDRTVEI